ncbi:MAG: hypothetical protein R3E87_10715 [Burkholderiaceae bacterium]
MSRQFSGFFDHFRQDHTFEALRTQADRLIAMQREIDARWPGMRLTVLSVHDDTLVLCAPNSALAAKSRQIVPSLIEAVAGYAPGLAKVRVKALPPPAAPPRPRAVKVIGEQALEQLQGTASELAAGPLRNALQRLIRRQLDQ